MASAGIGRRLAAGWPVRLALVGWLVLVRLPLVRIPVLLFVLRLPLRVRLLPVWLLWRVRRPLRLARVLLAVLIQ
jgi:hypothetical protein